ncbi:hypothetical protein [Micromonospora sp. NPDC048169]|uniref:hypothetical protein n=1 Tax=Micromonospora sp. NPDC048169 TaxID=3154711 RepID=UPI0033CA23D9
MSFLIRRNLPLAWAGWYDSFDTYGVGPMRRPWVWLGDGTRGDYNALGEFHLPANYFTNNGGGPSYEFQPFTPHWGLEWEVWWPVEGLAAQSFTCFITDSWARVGALFQNLLGIQLRHTSSGDTIGINGYPTIIGFNDHEGQFTPPAPYFGKYTTVRIWCENDEFLRLWVDGQYMGSQMLTNPTFKPGPDRRCVRFLNAALCDCWMRWIQHYDKPSSVPNKNVWVPQLTDNFNREDGPVDNGWTQIGTNAGLVGGSWANTGTTDGSRGLLRNTGISTGRVRIEATVGGAVGPNNTASSGLVLCSNAAGTSGLIANVIAGQLGIGYFSDSLSGNPPTFTYYRTLTTGVTVSAGDKIAFSSYGSLIWIEVNGTPRLYAVSDTYTANTYAGLRVSRASSTYSASWNDVTIFTGLG